MPKQFITHQAHRKIIDSVVDGFTGRSDEEAKRALAGEVVDLRKENEMLRTVNEIHLLVIKLRRGVHVGAIMERIGRLKSTLTEDQVKKYFDQ